MSNQSILESAAAAAAAATAALSDGTLKDCIPTGIETNAVAALAATEATPTNTTVEAAAVAAAAPPPPTTTTTTITSGSVSIDSSLPVLTNIIPAVPLPVAEQERDPNVPTERDVIVGSDLHSGTMLLHDLVRLQFYFWKKQKDDEPAAATKVETTALKKEEEVQETQQECNTSLTIAAAAAAAAAAVSNQIKPPTEMKDVEELASHLTQLFVNGRPYELAGLKDIPTPFFKGEGYFFEQITSPPEATKWRRLDKDQIKVYVSQLILTLFLELCNKSEQDDDTVGIMESVNILFANSLKHDSETKSPRPFDASFHSTSEKNVKDEPNQSGNKHMLFTASQHVSVKTKESALRIKAAFDLVTSKVQVNSDVVGTELIQTYPRYLIQGTVDETNSWTEMNPTDLAEFAVIFVFEIYLEKRIYEKNATCQSNLETTANVTPNSLQPAMNNLLSSNTAIQPSEEVIPAPTTHDVLFGRGGMTNGHPGNRRFRDIIALHRPDYMSATKMDKPNVARKIVRAIRSGNSPGRFLKKGPDGLWRDVGDKVAAEKTSQGLRERSNAEKRHRSAVRESIRASREGAACVEPNSKKIKLDNSSLSLNVDNVIPPNFNHMRIKITSPKKNKGGTEAGITTESLPANAVDGDGNVLVTDHDILCGRGGLTNHHKGNKRFRDIVALHRPDYVRAAKIQKPSVARVIVRAIRNGDPPGRFLKKDPSTGKWYDIGDKKAAEKTSQALREKSDEEKESNKMSAGLGSPTMIVPNAATTAAAAAAAAATNVDAALGDAAAALAQPGAVPVGAVPVGAVPVAVTETLSINNETKIKTDTAKGEIDESKGAGQPLLGENASQEEINNEDSAQITVQV